MASAIGAFYRDNFSRFTLLTLITIYWGLRFFNSVILIKADAVNLNNMGLVYGDLWRPIFWVGINWWYLMRRQQESYTVVEMIPPPVRHFPPNSAENRMIAPMILMINGSFGVGKTTIAKLLRGSLPGSAIYDPEWIGFFFRRLPKWIKLNGSGSDDYQDIALWRRSTVAGVRLFRLFVPGPVIVPWLSAVVTILMKLSGGSKLSTLSFACFA